MAAGCHAFAVRTCGGATVAMRLIRRGDISSTAGFVSMDKVKHFTSNHFFFVLFLLFYFYGMEILLFLFYYWMEQKIVSELY